MASELTKINKYEYRIGEGDSFVTVEKWGRRDWHVGYGYILSFPAHPDLSPEIIDWDGNGLRKQDALTQAQNDFSRWVDHVKKLKGDGDILSSLEEQMEVFEREED